MLMCVLQYEYNNTQYYTPPTILHPPHTTTHHTHRWEASPVGITSLTPAGTRVYSLALDGRIRGWPAAAPCHMDAVAWYVGECVVCRVCCV